MILPVDFDFLDNAKELFEIDWFCEVTLHPEFFDLTMVILIFRGCQDDNSGLREAIVATDVAKNFVSVAARKIEVQKHKIWLRGLLVLSLMHQELNALCPVGDPRNVMFDFTLLQRAHCQAG